jgi:transposase
LFIRSTSEKLQLQQLKLIRENRMNMHKNARLTPKGREVLIRRLERGERPGDVACAMGVSIRTVYKWRKRYREEGLAGLQDRSSKPARSPTRAPARIETEVIRLRHERRIMDRIADETGVSRATVGRILVRHGLNRWRDLEPAEPVVRYERDAPGELIHIDIKKLGRFTRTGHRITGDRTGQSNARGIGWEFVHVCVDDHSRLGFSQVLASERKEDAIAFLKAGSCLVSKDGDQGGTRDDGQWLLLSFEGIQQNL